MSQPVGVLALRIWRTDDGEIRARMTAILDIADPTPAKISYYASTEELKAAVAGWVERFSTHQDARREGRPPAGPTDTP